MGDSEQRDGTIAAFYAAVDKETKGAISFSENADPMTGLKQSGGVYLRKWVAAQLDTAPLLVEVTIRDATDQLNDEQVNALLEELRVSDGTERTFPEPENA